MTNVLLLGGTSEIGLAIVRRLAAQELVRPYLIGRDRDALAGALAGLRADGCVEGRVGLTDAEHPAEHDAALDEAFAQPGGVDVVVLAIGALGAQAGLDADPADAVAILNVNVVGAGSLLIGSLRRLRDQGAGTLVVLSSVAAERPRAGNAVYGAAKSGLDALAQGLADETAGSGVRVLVVRPGFVHTRMTAGLPAAPFATTPEAVAVAVVKALATDAHTIWVPGILRYVFAMLRHVPRPLFRRLPL